MTNNKPGNELISLQMAPVEQQHSSREKVPSPITMNNIGARLILEGRYSDALRCLGTSMKYARVLLARDRGQRRGSSNGADMSCKEVTNHPSVVAGRRGDADSTTTITVSINDPSSLEQERRRPSLHARRGVSSRQERGAGAISTSFSGQQETGSATLQTVGRLSQGQEDQPAEDLASPVTMTGTTTAAACPPKKTAKLMTSLALSDTYVYADPIILDDESLVCHRHRQCLMKITVTILFNMALAHHLMARSTLIRMFDEESSSSLDEEHRHELQRTCRCDLKRAVTLYTLSCRIHVFERLSMNEMIAMAHLNNLGQIHAILGNTSVSKAFFEKLLSNLALYTESYRDSEHQATRRGRRRLAGFYQNATQIILRGPELAPAA